MLASWISAKRSRTFASLLFDICFTTFRGELVHDRADTDPVFFLPHLRKYDPHLGPLEELTPVSTGNRFSQTDRAGDMCVSARLLHVRAHLRLELPA